jgi:hypothetical protein
MIQSITLKMEAVCSSEMSEHTCTTWFIKPKEDRQLMSKCFENLKTYVNNLLEDEVRNIFSLFFLWFCGSVRVMASSFLRFLDHMQWCTTICRTPPDEWSACRKELYLTTHNTDKRQTSMLQAGFEPLIPASERPQTHG